MECKDFLYFIDESTNIIYFNPINVWESEGCLANNYSDEEDVVIEDVAKELGLIGAVESGMNRQRKEKLLVMKLNFLNLDLFTMKSLLSL